MVTAEVTAANLPDTLSDKNQTVRRSSESLLVQALADNAAVAPTLTSYGVTYRNITVPIVSCAAGFVNNATVCEPCPAGTRHDSSTDTCPDCGIGKYQDQTGQTSCKACPDAMPTLRTNSVNVTDCVSKCKLETEYCKNNGICREGTQGSVSCDCSEYYTGDTCTIRRSVESGLSEVIIGVCVGIFALLLSGLAIGYFCYRRSRGRLEREKHSAMDKTSTVHDYTRSPYTVYRGYTQYPSPVFNEVYDFYSAEDKFSDQ
ncbi:sushi, von Willebrand factor type A, EGF and pentraxin domain-containing protein 1-like [Haliotis rubra]|uniref:sushi, von Willebrand factor type A, EGF and pentraxin domain-containing protein 1-like n=1 Tax=Haliotis rubra TaxID=36100 RepID=UPI001EE60124|nr:sushi, von Willebrand factor type A, EGF and pentraxin domain-containing protein 1-like [Haliotis rubra]